MSAEISRDSEVFKEYIRIKKRFKQNRTRIEVWADWLTKNFGSLKFLVFHVLWFSVWIIVNLGLTPIKPFDPYPFGFLTLVVSLEAIFFSIIILISENREQQISDFREELSLSLLELIDEKLESIRNNMFIPTNGDSTIKKQDSD